MFLGVLEGKRGDWEGVINGRAQQCARGLGEGIREVLEPDVLLFELLGRQPAVLEEQLA